MKFFHMDNPVFRFISRTGDMLLMSLLWFATSLPVITMGASTTALFYTCIKIIRGRDSSVVKDYFGAFKSNFRQSTIIFLIMAAIGAVAAADMYILANKDIPGGTVLNAVSIGIAVIFAATLLYVFPVQATFDNTVGATLRTAFLMSLKHWYVTIGLLAGAAAIAYICYIFPVAAYFFLLIGVGVFAMIYSLQFVNIFKQYNEVIAEDMKDKKWDKEAAAEYAAEASSGKKEKKNKVIK